MAQIEKLINNKQIAEMLGVSINTWRDMRQQKPAPIHFGKNLYRVSDIEKWLEARSQSRSARASASAR